MTDAKTTGSSKPAELDKTGGETRNRLSLAPLSLEDALRGAMETGKPPKMPKRVRPVAKREPTKRRQKKVKGSD